MTNYATSLKERLQAVLRGAGIIPGAEGFVGVAAADLGRAGVTVGLTLDGTYTEMLIKRLALQGCAHLADSATPGDNLEPEPCHRCGQYFVDGDSTSDETHGA